jgi:hypothetical protein
MKMKYNFYKIIVLFIALLTISTNIVGQTAQTINPDGGKSANLDDGLKIVVNTTGILSVYRQDKTQYFPGTVWPGGQGNGVTLTFRFDNGTTYNTSNLVMTSCSTTPAQQNGNNWTTSISGYVDSPISGSRFFVTINFQYTHPQRYFLVDYYVRAPFNLSAPETVHLYLSHDAYILGKDGSRGYQTSNSTGHFVGDYRDSTDSGSTCQGGEGSPALPRYPSTHGFKTSGSFRSYYSARYGVRDAIDANLRLTNTIGTTCVDDGVAVEFTIGPLSAGQIGTKQVLHGYGNVRGEFDNIVVNDPVPPTGLSSPVSINFTSTTFSEAEGDNSHLANNMQIEVSSGVLAQDQVCNFSVVAGGTAVQNTDFTYVKGFIIPAGDYTTPRTFTLNNFTILGNTNCQSNRTIRINIDSEACNDLIQPGTTRQTTYTILDDDTPTVNQPGNTIICNGITLPTTVFSGSTLPNTTYTWTNNNTAIGLAASGTGNISAFTATNTTADPITATITVTPRQGSCSGDPKRFTITVNPTTTVNAIANKTECAGTSVPITALSSPTTGTTFSWTNSHPAIGLAASGTGNIPAFTANNTTASPITATITVRPMYGSCAGTPRQFTITVNPRPTVNAIANRAECVGTSIPLTTVSSPTSGTTFAWTNSHPAIGLAASGSGNIPAFTATNTTSSPITATITVTPTYAGCVGTPRQFTITVNPRPTVNAIADRVECVGTSVPLTSISSPTTGATFTWTNSHPSIGLAASGTGNIPAFTATNTTSSPITATITITPTYAGCVGTAQRFTITVNPRPTVNVIANRTECVGTSIPLTVVSSPTSGATFIWTNSHPSIGLSASGTGSIPAFTTTNTTSSPITATISITPIYAGCIGTPQQFTITVNPRPTVNAIADRVECVGTSIPLTTVSSPTAGTTFAWTNSHPAIGLAASGTGNIPAFTATNTTSSPITATISITPTYAGCVGTPRQFTIKVYAATNAGKIEGNPFVCKGIRPLVIKGQPSTGGSGSFTYQWQQSSNNSTWTNISGATSLDYTPPILTSNTYFRRNTIDASCGTFPSNSFLIKVVATPTSLYWKSNAGDNNWNNPANWVDKNGSQLGMVPLVCTEVHIPGGASKYPSLDGTNTPQGIYGKPVCQNIVYHFGGEVAYPQNLTYEKAYVQYNWGYYNKTSGITANSQPTENVDGASAPKMQRGKWYALAAPLKNMASGDFALAGYPLTWQAVYNMANPATGILENIDFSKAFATNDVNLSKTNNTIAVKVAPYNTTIGYNNQRHLESLKGVIEIPFFENKTQVPFRPGHQYDELSKKSTFFYFDTKTLKQIYSPVGQMKRSNEAYRFIFENDNNITGTISVGGVNVKGYQQRVTVSGTSKKVMVGNPFMASINAKNFYDANATKLVSAEGYKVFSSASQTWVQYPFSATNNIGPLQAFVITLANGLNSADLLFPLEGNLALTGAQFKGSVQRSVDTNSLSVRSVDNQNQNTEYAALSADYDSDVKKVVSKDGHDTPEAFFITSNNDYNLLQNYDDKEEYVRLGVKSSNIKDAITLEFGNVGDFAAQEGVHPILEDKLLNIKHDLLKNSNYRFNQQKLDSTSQYADVNRFILRLPKSTTGINDDKENDKSIVISYVRNELSVYADYSLSRVLVYDLKGYEVHNSGDLGTSSLSYIKHLSLPHGSYIVKVSTTEGKTVTKKIITQQ